MTAGEVEPNGTLVIDTASDQLGYVMGHEGPWDADPAHVRRATDEERLRALVERTRAMNTFSSGGIIL
ncbi:hypothetical protein ACIQVL_08465 [Streptomyces sp. NPDC090499]|uniref:hypothetical protein n=1 Tax=Streptomyces sp. NPDC090499 TaxID=3365965 RepID=UPI0037FBA3FB